MSALDPHRLAWAAARPRAVADPFDDQWLRDLHWTPLHEEGGLVWWRVRASAASRSWRVLRPRAEAGDSDFRRLEREWQMAQWLQPEWAVAAVAKLYFGEGPLLVLDDDDGRPLSQLADGQLGVGRFLRLAVAASSALAAAHAQGIIHRDIKPAHLLLGKDGQLRLSGFTLAVHEQAPLPGEPGEISGSLPYMSPEQGGRLDQTVDQRSDLYSLGVTFYELLTGQLPFSAREPAQWLHQHVAVLPLPLAAYRPDLPQALQSMLDRLLAKASAERFPSASALTGYLRQALGEWTEFGQLPAVNVIGQPLARQRRLVGREEEYRQLLGASERLLRGEPGGIVTLAGVAGIGKTALVRQLRGDCAGGRLLLGGGRFEGGAPRSPYAVLSAVLASLLARVVCEEPETLERYGSRLKAALGTHAQLLARRVPELEWVTGPLAASNEPQAGEGRRRLLGLFLRAIRALGSAERPLLVFFDDAHWLDRESLAFFQALRAADFEHLLLVVAYQDAAAGPALQTLLSALDELPVPHCALRLLPLDAAQVSALVHARLADAPASEAWIERLQHVGGGNPLFVQQAVQLLLDAPSARDSTVWPGADLLDVLATRLGQLPSDTRALLATLALMGNEVEGWALAVAGGLSDAQLAKALAPAFAAQLIRPQQNGLGFCHDHVRAAALRDPAPADVAEAHRDIALRLVRALPVEARGEQLFRVAAHVQQAASHGLDDPQRNGFINVLLRAAQHAKDAAAARFALDYLDHAQPLMAQLQGPPDPARAQAMAFLRAQCLILTARYAEADTQIMQLLAGAPDLSALASLYVLKTEILLLAGDYPRAVGAALEGLACLGVHLDSDPDEEDAEAVWQAVQGRLAGREIDTLCELAELTDPRIASQLQLLTTAGIIGSFIQPNLMFVLLGQALCLSLEHGVNAAGAQAFAWFGVASAHRADRHAEGLAWAQVALRLVEQRGYSDQRSAVLLALDQISVWARPLSFALACAEQALRHSLARDTPSMGCYANNHIVSNLLVMGAPIERILRQIDTGLQLAHSLDFVDSQNILFTQALYIQRLAGDAARGMRIPSREDMARRIAVSHMGPARFWWSLFEGLFFFLEGNFQRAHVEFEQAWALSWATPAHIHLIDLAFFSTLNAAARLDGSAAAAQALERPLERLAYLASLNPKAFADRLDLARAEVLRAQGHSLEALRLYDESVAKAAGCGAVHIQGLAHELASRCHQALGLHVSARTHLRKARDCWRRWGAHALAEQIEARHPYLQEQAVGARSSVELPGGQQQLDMMSITKACQALSRELQVEQLLKTLLANTVVHAGASQAMLLLGNGDSLSVEAVGHASAEGVHVTLTRHAPLAQELPMSLVRTALRSRQSVVIENARYPQQFADDPYLRERGAGSMLCVPLLKQNEIIGVMYLENLLACGVFNRARVDVLEVLAAQAAISLTTARLYSDLLAENRRRRDSEHRLRTSRAALALGQAVSRQGTFLWNPTLDASFCSTPLLAQLDLCAPVASAVPALPAAERVHADDRRPLAQALETAVRAHSAFRVQFRLHAPGGEVHHLEALGEPDGEGNYIGVLFDVTERYRTEAALRQARAEMAQTSQRTVLAELAASIAHEINQPLLSILANASASLRWLERSEPALDEALEGVRDILTDGRRAADIVSAMRSLACQAPLQRAPLDLAALIRRVVELTRAELDDKQVLVDINIDRLPSIDGDPVQLQQVILNLISNAVEAMQAVEPARRTLRLHGHAVASAVLVVVEDSGPGIAPEHREEIFQAFYSTKASGMGMGLAICRSIIEAHGGRLLAVEGRQGETLMAALLPLGRDRGPAGA
jgi:predicted ATPase/signal transduction histidine kinase